MLAFLTRRILLALPALFGVALVVFLLMRAVPGDVVTNLVGLEGNVTPERRAELQRMFGLDLPVHIQFVQWLGAAVQGDLGSSLRTGRSVSLDLVLRFPVTLQLTFLSLCVALLVAVLPGLRRRLGAATWWITRCRCLPRSVCHSRAFFGHLVDFTFLFTAGLAAACRVRPFYRSATR